MSRLSARLAVNLVAVALIGLLAADVLYVFAEQRDATRERRLVLQLAAQQAIAGELSAVARAHGVVLTRVRHDGTFEQSEDHPMFAVLAAAPAPFVAQGHEHVALALGDGPFARVIASRPLEDAASRTLAEQPRVLAALSGVALLMVVLGLFFLRRTVLQPLERITTWARTHDEGAILRFGESSDGLADLGRAIIAMNQRGEDDRRRIENQLRELQKAHDELRSTRDQLVRAERLAAVGRLAAGLAHEIGNPLAVLTGFVGMLDDPALSAEQRRDAYRRMEKELARIQGTVRSLLDFSRAPTSVRGAAAVSDVLAQLGALLTPQAKKKNVALVVRPADTTAAIDANALTQVLLNLALNALDAVSDGGRVEVTTTREAEYVVISVSDDGPGVAPELADKIFEPFFTTKPAGQGTGLGLSVCESVVLAAGGSLSLDRGVTRGARFVLRLPAYEDGTSRSRAMSV